jgi:hypothetical protein
MGIRNFLIDENHLLTYDWMLDVYEKSEKNITEVRNIKQIYRDCIKGIMQSDIIIVEDTVSNFSTGHQITMALQRKKPTLVLWQKSKERQFNDSFINGIQSDLLEVHEYEGDEYKEIIKVFVNKYADVKERNRFHLVLNNIERNYIDWVHLNTKKSRTQIIRDAINNLIDKDEEYSKYLLKKD